MKHLILIFLSFCTSLVIAQSFILGSEGSVLVERNGIAYARVSVLEGAFPAITCNQLIVALNANEVRARRDYPLNQLIRIVDVARDINVDSIFREVSYSSDLELIMAREAGLPSYDYFDVAMVRMSASDDWLNGCVAEMASLDEAIDLNKDESVDLLCKTWEESRGDVRFKNCTVTNQAQASSVSRVSQEPFTGVTESYFENGQLRIRGNWKAGLQDGLAEFYFENGQLRTRGNWKAGLRDGLEEHYYENGQLESSINYIASELINGECWNEQGLTMDCSDL